MIEEDFRRDRYVEIFSSQANFARGYSPLYVALLECLVTWLQSSEESARRLDRDPLNVEAVMTRVLEFCDRGQWESDLEPTLRLAACLHARVLNEDAAVSTLRQYYSTVGGTGDPLCEEFEADLFIALEKLAATLIEDAAIWKVQTNESSRGILWLLPALILGVDRSYLLELGASAGLNLYAEQRSYELRGESGEPIRLGAAEERQFSIDAGKQELFEIILELFNEGVSMPEIIERVGGDRHPIDLDNVEHELHLRACIWGDQESRLQRLQEGIAIHKSASSGQLNPRAVLREMSLPDDLHVFLKMSLPANPKAPVIVFNSYVTAYLNDVDHRSMNREMRSFAHGWSLRHNLPWMWVHFEPPRQEDEAAPHLGWCRWVVELFSGTESKVIELGWAHPHLVKIEFSEGIRELITLRD